LRITLILLIAYNEKLVEALVAFYKYYTFHIL